MHIALKSALAMVGIAFSTLAVAQVTFYEGEGFRGGTFTADGPVRNLDRTGFNDRAASAVVDNGRWEVCEDAYFQGRCVVLRPGQYDSLRPMGLNHKISSVRPAEHTGYNRYGNEAPVPPTRYGYEQRQYDPGQQQRPYDSGQQQ